MIDQLIGTPWNGAAQQPPRLVRLSWVSKWAAHSYLSHPTGTDWALLSEENRADYAVEVDVRISEDVIPESLH